MALRTTDEQIDQQTWFLPDFCAWRLLLGTLILGQLLAFLLLLSPLGKSAYNIDNLLRVSLFIHSVSVSYSLILCLAKKQLRQLNHRFAALISYLLIILITLLYSHLVWKFRLDTLAFLSPVQGLDQQIHVKKLNIQIDVQGSIHFIPFQYNIFMLRNLGVSAIVGLIALRYTYLSYHWRLVSQHEAEFRIQALQARIHPHFLFNSMNTIASLTRIDPELAERAVEDLSALFRASLADANKPVKMSDEIALCEQYLHIEGLRLGNRLKVNWSLETLPLDALIPGLCLQPLIENAIYYGIQPLPEGGTIQVTGLSDGKIVRLEIENPLPTDPMTTPKLKHKGNHIAIDNLRQRLKVYYGRAGRLDMQDQGDRFKVSLRFPYHTKK